MELSRNGQGAVACELTKRGWTDHSHGVDVRVKQAWVQLEGCTAPYKAKL